jgi:hypothetical protein
LQQIDGIDLTTYNQDPTTNENVLKISIAECMTGVSSDNIQSWSVAGTRRRLMGTSGAEVDITMHISTSASFITATYVVSVTNSILNYNELSAQLTQAIKSGDFNTILTEEAKQYGATSLETASSSSISTQNLLTNSSSGSSGLSAGAIAGIVIAVIFAVTISLTFVYWCVIMDKPPESVQDFSNVFSRQFSGSSTSSGGGRSNNNFNGSGDSRKPRYTLDDTDYSYGGSSNKNAQSNTGLGGYQQENPASRNKDTRRGSNYATGREEPMVMTENFARSQLKKNQQKRRGSAGRDSMGDAVELTEIA